MKQMEQEKKTAQQAMGLVISTGAGKIWAAMVRRRNGSFERTYQATFELAEGVDNAVKRLLEHSDDPQAPVVIGLDSSQLRYVDISLPPVESGLLPQLIRTQAEARLPLDSDRLQLAWRVSAAAQGYECTVAAARWDAAEAALGRLSLNGRLFALVPDAVGFAHLMPRIFAAARRPCIVLRRRTDGIAMIRLDEAGVVRSAVIHAEPSDILERPVLVMQDLQIELESMAEKQARQILVTIWPGDDPFLHRAAEALKRDGWPVEALTPDRDAMKQARLDDAQDAGGHLLDASGLALLGLTETEPAFDFMRSRQLSQTAQDAALHRKKRLRTVAAIAVLAVLSLAVGYWSLLLETQQLRRELEVQVDGVKAQTILQQQAYQEAVARARVDMIALLEAIQDSRDGILLDSIEFEQGKPVKLVAVAGGYEQVYGFQKRLEDKDGVNQVRLIDPRLDERTRQVRFTLQFHYQHFTGLKP